MKIQFDVCTVWGRGPAKRQWCSIIKADNLHEATRDLKAGGYRKGTYRLSWNTPKAKKTQSKTIKVS